MKLDINGTVRDIDVPPDMPLVWVLVNLQLWWECHLRSQRLPRRPGPAPQ